MKDHIRCQDLQAGNWHVSDSPLARPICVPFRSTQGSPTQSSPCSSDWWKHSNNSQETRGNGIGASQRGWGRKKTNLKTNQLCAGRGWVLICIQLASFNSNSYHVLYETRLSSKRLNSQVCRTGNIVWFHGLLHPKEIIRVLILVLYFVVKRLHCWRQIWSWWNFQLSYNYCAFNWIYFSITKEMGDSGTCSQRWGHHNHTRFLAVLPGLLGPQPGWIRGPQQLFRSLRQQTLRNPELVPGARHCSRLWGYKGGSETDKVLAGRDSQISQPDPISWRELWRK